LLLLAVRRAASLLHSHFSHEKFANPDREGTAGERRIGNIPESFDSSGVTSATMKRERERAIELDASKHIAIFVLAESDYIFVLEFLKEERR